METSGDAAAVALGRSGGAAIVREVPRTRRHNLELLPCVAAVCEEAGASPASLAGVCVSRGPGSFTGLRVALAAAQMIGTVTGCDLVGVSTIEALARNVPPRFAGQPVAVCLNTKRGWTYGAVFVDGRPLSPPASVRLDDLLAGRAEGAEAPDAPDAPDAPVPVAALGQRLSEQAERYGAGVPDGVEPLEGVEASVRTEVVLELGRASWLRGETTPAQRLTPIYGREPEAVRLWRERS